MYDLNYIGQIPVENKAPYLIFSGRECTECDANIAIYIHSPADGELVIEQEQSYQYPGTEKHYETDSILYNSRAFYGQVLNNSNGVIWYESRLLENGKMESSIFLSYLDNEELKDTTYEDNGSLEETIALMQNGLCAEIEGIQYTSEP